MDSASAVLLITLAFTRNGAPCLLSTAGSNAQLVPTPGTYLLTFTVRFEDHYPFGDPLVANDSNVYAPHEWNQVISKHGQTLLSLGFDYNVLSLWTLSFGVQTVGNVTLKDNPFGCLGQLPYTERLQKLMYLITNDSLLDGALPQDQYLCYEVIKKSNGYGTFAYNCCRPYPDGFACAELPVNKWTDTLYWLVFTSKLLFFLLGPLILEKWFFNQSIRKTDYLVTLPSPLKRNLLLKKASSNTTVQETSIFDETDVYYPGHFKKFKQLSQVLPFDKVFPTEIDRIHLQVDHTHLLDDQSVPVGPFLFLWQNVFQCGLMKYEPFRSCCAQSIIGSWDMSFLCIRLGNKESLWNIKCRRYLSYRNITGLIAGFILILAVPLPYFCRLLFYFNFEFNEINARHNAIRDRNLKLPVSRNLLQYLTPYHPFLIFVYTSYFMAFVLLAVFQKWQRKTFDDIVLGSLHDLRKVSRAECIRLLLSHLLLPFEKFGICCGAIVAVIYYPFALSLCVLTTVFYMVPTLYMTGRLILQVRPWVIRKIRIPYVDRSAHPVDPLSSQPLDVLSLGITSLESCMMLNNISPLTIDPKGLLNRQLSRDCVIRELVKACTGILCVIWMLSVLLIYAESVGFLVEVCIMVLMGTVVNAGFAANYIMVVFWCIMYSVNCYSAAYKIYLALHKKVFDSINSKLADSIKKGTRHRYRGYKYFSSDELKEKRQAELDAEMISEMEVSPKVTDRRVAVSDPFEDTLEYINGRLYWHMKSLVLFVDANGIPRIPLHLFHLVCHLRGSGYPGPIYRGLIAATKQFAYMLIFLGFVVLVVFAFESAYAVSSTNQLLLTLAGGLIPFVVTSVLAPNQGSLNVEESSFQTMLNDLLRNFVQEWPVHDFTFKVDDVRDDDSSTHAGLVVTIKVTDEMGDETDGRPVKVKLLKKPSELNTIVNIASENNDGTGARQLAIEEDV